MTNICRVFCIILFIIMEKKTNTTQRISKEALETYINSQFADWRVPQLQHFIDIKYLTGTDVLAKPFQTGPNIILSPQIKSDLESQAIIYVHSGVVQLFKFEQKSWRKQSQCKQGSFFTLINYKNLSKLQPQFFKLNFKSQCLLSHFSINKSFGYSQMRKQWYKNLVLSKVFFFNDSGLEIQRKKAKFRQFSDKFHYQIYRRQSRLSIQGQENTKLYIIANGQAKITKQLKIGKQKGQQKNNIDILYVGEGSVIGGQLFLMNSKIINTIISNHVPAQFLAQKQIQNEDQQEQVKVKSKNKNQSKFDFKHITVNNGGYQLYNPHLNLSNFNVIVQSANLQVFYIDLSKLVPAISQRSKYNVTKLIQQNYITILRRIDQKMINQMVKAETKIKRKNEMFDSMTAKFFTHKPDSKQDSTIKIQLRNSEIGTMTKKLGELKTEAVMKKQNPSITTRTALIMQQKLPKQDYKQKITRLLQTKLQGGYEKSQAYKSEVVTGLSDIFMKTNEGRSQDIEIRSKLIDKKCNILDKRGGWQQGWDSLKEQGIYIPPQKSKIPHNYLQGVNMKQYAYKTMEKFTNKIHQTNKIKQQFMKIKSQCPSCTCYQRLQSFSNKRRTMSTFARTSYKTSQGWGRTTRVELQDEPLQLVYNKIKMLNQKTKEKYNHSIHLLKVRKSKSQLQRRKSTPLIVPKFI